MKSENQLVHYLFLDAFISFPYISYVFNGANKT
jgi:hypothetical protein